MAVEAFRKAVREDGKNPYFQKGLGQAYLATGKYDDAVSAFRKALELNQYYVDVRNDLGTALILSGRRNEGKNEFLAAFNDATNPTPEISSRNLGQRLPRGEALRRGHQLVPHQRQPQSQLSRRLPRPRRRPRRLRHDRRRGGHAGGGAKECPQSAPSCSTSARPTRASAVWARRGPAWKRRGSAIPWAPAGRRAAQLLQQFPSK
jgi:tetratricopeptide (TPR) repeat protein